VHLGAYLLLRVSPLLELSTFLSVLVIVLGLSTALFAVAASRVQADVKTALAFASLTQVGIIVAEIGIGFRYLALIHIVGHACLRTLQLLRAPTLLHDYVELENAIGSRLSTGITIWERILPAEVRTKLYGITLQRAFLDSLIDRYVVAPFCNVFQWCDAAENRWTDWLSGGRSRETNHAADPGQVFDDLAG
ncbi:MAG: oxidoreductase, partial [Planctomycetales bacterium]|nr:oxidoreductase [Planctomycetales bacterium]